MSVIVHLLRISYLVSSVHLMLKSFPIKDLLVSIALGWVHVVRESKCKRRFVNDKHVSGKPSKCLYTVIRLTKRKSTLTEGLSVHNFGQTGCFLSRGQSLWCSFKRMRQRNVNCIAWRCFSRDKSVFSSLFVWTQRRIIVLLWNCHFIAP